jgi:thiamine biosynthesis lipoprotein
MELVTLALNSMATRFEFVLHGEDQTRLRAAGEEALREIQNLEDRLSLYKPASEIARINLRATHEPVRVTPEVFRLLEWARALHGETEGAFDPTIGPLVRCWGFMSGKGRLPSPAELEQARARVGMQFVELDDQEWTVRFQRPGMMLDLGAVGKGYAIEKAAELLREAGVAHALLHGGTSTVYALGPTPEGKPWEIALEIPALKEGEAVRRLGRVALRDEALSVSAVWGRHFREAERLRGHVLDPRTGYPVDHALMTALAMPSATETDALSTGMLTLGPDGLPHLLKHRPDLRWLLVREVGGQLHCAGQGLI